MTEAIARHLQRQAGELLATDADIEAWKKERSFDAVVATLLLVQARPGVMSEEQRRKVLVSLVELVSEHIAPLVRELVLAGEAVEHVQPPSRPAARFLTDNHVRALLRVLLDKTHGSGRWAKAAQRIGNHLQVHLNDPNFIRAVDAIVW